MGCYMQLLSTGNADDGTVPSVLLFFDNKRYVFNLGEGFQRFSLEYKILSKIGSKMEAILLTQLGPQTLGGLPGLILSMDSMKLNLVSSLLKTKDNATPLIGPQNVDVFLESMAAFSREGADQFVARPMDFSDQECATLIDDEQIAIKGIVLHVQQDATNNTNGSNVSDGETDDNGEPQRKKMRLIHSIRDGQSFRKVNSKSTVLCYICELKDLPGKFLPEKAAQLGVPKGPLFGKLQKGQAVKAVSGEEVRPDEVMEPAIPGPIALVIDCPTLQHIAPLLQNLPLQKIQEQSNKVTEECRATQKFVSVIFHLGPKKVIESSEYQEWMSTFGKLTNHIIGCGQQNTSNNLKGSATVQTKLNFLDNSLFPLFNNTQQQSKNESNGCELTKQHSQNLLRYTLIPFRKQGIDLQQVQEDLNHAEIQQELNSPELLKLIQQYNQDKQQVLQDDSDIPECIKNASDKELEIVFLGTGAALPSKYRNTTGVLLDFFDKGTMLLDCGEYSLKQLLRKYGEEGCRDVLRRLKAVWISHIHADHHAGLYSVLDKYSEIVGQQGPSLIIFGPKPLSKILHGYTKVCQHVNFQFIRNVNLLSKVTREFSWAQLPDEMPEKISQSIQQVKEQLNLVELETFPTLHCKFSYGLVLKGGSGWKVVVSGDSYPCEPLQEAAKGATLLIQEATFENSLIIEAQEKRHCTSQQALEISKNAGLYRTILSHFSQRYPKVPKMDELVDSKEATISFDLMTVNLKDLPWLPKIMPLLSELFKDEVLEEKNEAEIAS